MEDTRHAVGRRGEDLAAEYLAERGWRVLARNYRAGPKEIDIVAARDGVVAFVEVKTRSTTTGGGALEPIRRLKQRAVVAAARRWMHENRQRAQVYRFDAVGVALKGGRAIIEHVPDAWRP